MAFLRGWFDQVDEFSVSVWFKRDGELDSRQSIVGNGDCEYSYGFSIQHEDEHVVDDITTVGGTAQLNGGTVRHTLIFYHKHAHTIACTHASAQPRWPGGVGGGGRAIGNSFSPYTVMGFCFHKFPPYIIAPFAITVYIFGGRCAFLPSHDPIQCAVLNVSVLHVLVL